MKNLIFGLLSMLAFGCGANQVSSDATSDDQQDSNKLVNEICDTTFQLKWGSASLDCTRRQIKILEAQGETTGSMCLEYLQLHIEYKQLWIGEQTFRRSFLNELLKRKSRLKGEYDDLIIVETSRSGEIATYKNYLFMLANQDSRMFIFSASPGGGWEMSIPYKCDKDEILKFFTSLNRDPDCELYELFEGGKIFTRLSKNGDIISRVMLGLTEEESTAFHDSY